MPGRHDDRRRRASTSSPAASTCTRTSTCRSAARPRPTTSSPARSPRRTAARRRSSTSRSSTRGQTLHHALRHVDEEGRGQGGDRLRLPHDHDRADRPGRARRWTRSSAQGVTSFKLFMAYPGVFMLDDASDLPGAAARRARTAARSACTPRTAASSTCSSSRRCAEGKTAPKYHALTRPARAEARGDAPRDRARRDGRRAGLHRPPLGRRGARDGDARRATAACRPTPRPARSTCSSPTTTTRSPASTARST